MSPSSKEAREPRFTPWVVPLRRVFPWWYLVACAATFAVTLLVDSSGSAASAFWGPAIGVAIRDRQFTAYRRKAKDLPVERRDLIGPRWFESLCAALLAVFFVGVSFALGFLFGGTPGVLRWIGVGLIATSLVVTGVLVLVLLARKRRRRSAQIANEAAPTADPL